MRNTYRTALDLTAWFLCGAGAIAADIAIQAHPTALQIHTHGPATQAFATIAALSAFFMLDRLSKVIAYATWRRADVETCAACGEPFGATEYGALVHEHHTRTVYARTGDTES